MFFCKRGEWQAEVTEPTRSLPRKTGNTSIISLSI